MTAINGRQLWNGERSVAQYAIDRSRGRADNLREFVDEDDALLYDPRPLASLHAAASASVTGAIVEQVRDRRRDVTTRLTA